MGSLICFAVVWSNLEAFGVGAKSSEFLRYGAVGVFALVKVV